MEIRGRRLYTAAGSAPELPFDIQFFELTGERITPPAKALSGFLLVAVGVMQCSFKHDFLKGHQRIIEDQAEFTRELQLAIDDWRNSVMAAIEDPLAF